MTAELLDRDTVDRLVRLPRGGSPRPTAPSHLWILRQSVRYDYTGPVADLRQRLVLVPPHRHGDQQRLTWWAESSQEGVRTTRVDRFGNLVLTFTIPTVESHVEFRTGAIIERSTNLSARRVRADPAWRLATRLTQPDEELAETAKALASGPAGGVELAERICTWVARRLRYEHGVTTTTTTAAEACNLGGGVCQDFAHVMVTICRAAGLPARYVSGHLVGEGPSHAWVEVLVPDTSDAGFSPVAFDPTHARRCDLAYLTVATGRDYRDVAPTSGTCRADAPGLLSFHKQLRAAPARPDVALSGRR